MKTTRLILAAALTLIGAAFPFVAGAAETFGTGSYGTVSYSVDSSIEGARIQRLDCLSSSTGIVSVALPKLPGILAQVDIVPDTGATSPTQAFDVKLLYRGTVGATATGSDLLNANGADLVSTTTYSFIPVLPDRNGANDGGGLPVLTAPPIIYASGVGSANGFTVYLTYIRFRRE